MKVSRSCALWSSVCCVSVLWVPAVWYTWNTEYISAIDRHGPDGRTHASRQKVAIILQRSPVEMADQYKRLEAIDNSWADWGKQNGPAIHDINVYASITNPQEKDMTNLASVAHITPVIVRDLNPLVRLTDALLAVSVRGRSTPTWVVLANDHTFFIIPNLSCFLASLDYDDVVYTGNSLAIKMSDGVLVFASGGGGAVLSAAAVKITLLAWTLADISRVSEALRVVNSSISTGSIVPMSKPGVSWVDYLSFCAPSVVVSEYKDSTQSFHTNSGVFQLSLSPSCLDGINLLRSLQLLVFIFEKRAAQYVITLYITKTVSLLLRRLDSEPRTVQFTNSNKRYEGNATSFLLDEEKIAKKCVDHSKWGLDNPGLFPDFALVCQYNSFEMQE